MNKITVHNPAPKLLSLSELQSGEFYIGVPRGRIRDNDVLFVASASGPRHSLSLLDGGIPSGGDTVLVRLMDGYVLKGLASDYCGYLLADVEVTTTPRA